MVDMKKQKQYVKDLMAQLTFPSDAQKTFLDAFDTIAGDEAAASRFSRVLEQYEESEHCPYGPMLDEVKAIGETLGIHEYTVSLLLFLCLAEILRCRYAERGLEEQVWHDSLMDLRYKLEECRLVFRINGSFVASWFPGFFNLTRFALGRLQFELVKTPQTYTVGNTILPAGSKAINIHIPRTGTKLSHTEVLRSYQLAAEHFADAFQGQPMVFICHSWLLDPWNLTVLSPESNLAAFYRDFQIVATGDFQGYGEMWRLFDCLCTENITDLPKDSSLRCAYAGRMQRGETIGWGMGLFFYCDGKILRE